MKRLPTDCVGIDDKRHSILGIQTDDAYHGGLERSCRSGLFTCARPVGVSVTGNQNDIAGWTPQLRDRQIDEFASVITAMNTP